ncbi:hypothetical protein LXL04_003096 [Taraxacum kok-saghyz]
MEFFIIIIFLDLEYFTAARERGYVEKKKILDLFETWTAAPSSSLFGIQQKQDLKNNFLFHQVWDSDGVSRRRDIVKRERGERERGE